MIWPRLAPKADGHLINLENVSISLSTFRKSRSTLCTDFTHIVEMFYFWRISMRKSMEKFTFVHGKPLSRQSSSKSRHLSSKFTLKFTELFKEPAFNFYLLLFLNFYEIRHELFHFASAIFSLRDAKSLSRVLN